MIRIQSLLFAGALALACVSGPALAQTDTSTTVPVKNAAGVTVNVAGQADAAGYFHYRDVMEGVLSTGAPQSLTMDSTDAGAWAHITNWPSSFGITGTPTFNIGTAPTINVDCLSGCSGGGGSGGAVTQSGTWSVGINGSLPAYASTPTFNLGNLNGAATSAYQSAVQSAPGTSASTAETIQGSASGVPVPVSGPLTSSQLTSASLATSALQSSTAATLHSDLQAILTGPLNIGGSVTFSGSLPAFAATPAFKEQDSGGGDATDSTNHAVRVNCVVGCSSAVTNAGTFAVQNTAATPAGTNIIGKFGIDQTTPGTTNGVVINATALTTTNGSSTITTGGTFQSILASNSSRNSCFIQNPTTATEVLYVYFGATGSATTATSISLTAGSSVSCAAGRGVATDNIAATGATTGHAFIEMSQ